MSKGRKMTMQGRYGRGPDGYPKLFAVKELGPVMGSSKSPSVDMLEELEEFDGKNIRITIEVVGQ